ncbi:HpcH/HpaI aldolase/citrate lyase family protein [Altericroceibacterium endophyticum]|uniref:CoA ester lyase n=1 Tax=Altericroceibacterium endophyticum TaxID=1808508 RepID=A0A6I4T715_9SPHN|nr:CoA ester lyase [Altericroceibacterium endophyticum]MXO66627.1 CoA ester lyase [Altericroceibacterium endophyticum]
MRSWLFIPGDSERKLAKAASCGADILIVDLEDAVAPDAKPKAREMACEWLREERGEGKTPRWTRINAMDTPFWRDDVEAVLRAAPDGIMLPKAAGPAQVEMLAKTLLEVEADNGLRSNSTRIMPLVSETPQATLTIPAYGSSSIPRLAGLTWGAEDLSAAVGASRKRNAAGEWTDLFRMVRSQVLLSAHAAQVAAIDTLHADFRDLDGLKRIAAESRADGFAGMLAIHPAQVEIINEAFAISAAERAQAQAIVDAFAANPGAGVLQVDGKMVDQPHLVQARKLLDRA